MPKQLLLVDVVSGSPAAQVGLKRNDYLLAVNGQALTQDSQLRDFTKAHAGERVLLDVRQGNIRRSIWVTLRPPNATNGYLGVMAQPIYRLRYNLFQSVIAAIYITGGLFIATIWGIVLLLVHLPQLIIGLFGPSVPSAAGQASGPVGIIFDLQSIASLGWTYVWLFVANISVALAAFNVMPIPALDGGRLAIILIARLQRKPIDPELEAKIHFFGFTALLGLVAIISVYDFRKPH